MRAKQYRKKSIAIILSILFNLIRDNWDSMLLFWSPFSFSINITIIIIIERKNQNYPDVQMCDVNEGKNTIQYTSRTKIS